MNAKDAAKESSIKAGYNPNIAADAVGQAVYETAFRAGAEWQKEQSPWISVKDNLPPERVNVFFLVEWRGIHKEYHAGWYRNGIWESEQQIYSPNSFLGNVTHWMPIPQ